MDGPGNKLDLSLDLLIKYKNSLVGLQFSYFISGNLQWSY